MHTTVVTLYSNQSERLETGRDARELLETAIKLLDTIDDNDQDLQQMERNFESRLMHV
jgi:hypothetical protein